MMFLFSQTAWQPNSYPGDGGSHFQFDQLVQPSIVGAAPLPPLPEPSPPKPPVPEPSAPPGPDVALQAAINKATPRATKSGVCWGGRMLMSFPSASSTGFAANNHSVPDFGCHRIELCYRPTNPNDFIKQLRWMCSIRRIVVKNDGDVMTYRLEESRVGILVSNKLAKPAYEWTACGKTLPALPAPTSRLSRCPGAVGSDMDRYQLLVGYHKIIAG